MIGTAIFVVVALGIVAVLALKATGRKPSIWLSTGVPLPPFSPLPSGSSGSTQVGPAAPRLSLNEAVLRLARAIAGFETGTRSAFDPDSSSRWSGRAGRNNNPGNLRFSNQPGAVGQDEKGYAIFDSVASGWSALLNDVKAKVTGRTRTGLGPNSTLFEFFQVYAPATENPTASYAATVARELDIETTTKFNEWVLV